MKARSLMVVFVGIQVLVASVGLVLKVTQGGCYPFAWQMFSCG